MMRRTLAALLVLSLVLGPAFGTAAPRSDLDADVPAVTAANATASADSNATASADSNATASADSNATAADNEPPLADAGLDQTVPRDAVVLLDGRGSRDPDGTVVAFAWSIVAPDGSAVAPACGDCPRTNFTAARVGTYAVTLSVTDDDGATSNDTLYVTVSSGTGPAVTVTGPDRVPVGSSATLSASVTPGAAPPERLRWTVAGTGLPAVNLSDGRRTTNLTRTFPAPGNYTVAATVTDADGLTATGTHTVTVVAPSPPPGPPAGPGPGPGGSTGAPGPSIAATVAPVVRGDQVVTGTRPLRGSYRLDVPGGPGNVSHVEWHTEAGRFASGLRTGRSWTPGDHELFAVVRYRDGSRDVATFPDGDRRVVADPRPNLTVDGLSTNGSIRGAVTGADAYGNLRTVTVAVDGEVVARWPTTTAGFQRGDVRRKRLTFLYRAIDSGRVHRVSFVARDARGQTVTVERRVTPVGRPVVIRSEFVNDPVDSYHERIDPERYTAHHVLVVDLNGISLQSTFVNYSAGKSEISKLNNQKVDTDRYAVFHSYWAAEEPGDYFIAYNINSESGGMYFVSQKTSSFSVTPSPPELRYTITTDGTPDQGRWGARIDASRSFDPDGTDVEYIWKLGADPISPDNSTAKLSSLQLATLVVEDGYDLRASNEFFFESNYNPGLGFVEEVTEGPYRPNETVRFRVGTRAYKLPKNTYSVDIGIRTSAGEAEVVEWRKGEVTAEMLAESGRYDPKDVGSKVWTGVVSVPASELTGESGMPKVAVYNEELPGRNVDSRRLPGATVLANAGTYRTNIEVTDLRYLVERPVVDRVTVRSAKAKSRYLADGYSIADRSHYATEYVVEERVQVQAAKYETRRRSFASSRNRRVFLESTPGWRAAGTETSREWRTDVEYLWRSSPRGEGTYTGRTRRVRVAAAEYRTQYEFRYEYRTLGGREVSGTYWAFRKRRPDDRATGRSRRVKVADSKYETQYQFRVEKRERVTVVRYLVERRVRVQQALYEWQPYRRTTDEAFAKRLARLDSDYRIGGSSPTYEWTLTKQVGTEEVVVESYREESNVVETRATVTWDVVRVYINSRTLQRNREVISEDGFNYRYGGIREMSEIKGDVINEDG